MMKKNEAIQISQLGEMRDPYRIEKLVALKIAGKFQHIPR
jgi:hypothetical protein